MANQTNKPKNPTKKHVARLEHDRRQVAIVRTVAIVMAVIVAVLLIYGYIDTNYLQKQKPVAEVNGEKITVSQLQERIQLQRANLFNAYQRFRFFQENYGLDYSQQIQQIQSTMQFPQILGQQILDQLIDEALIRQEAEKLGITVTEDEVEKFIQEESFSFFPDGTATPTVTPTPFEYPTPSSRQLTLVPYTATPTTGPTFTPAPTSTPDRSPTATAAPPTPTFVPEEATPTATPYTLDGYKTEYQASLDEYKKYGVSESTYRSVYRNILLRNKLLEAITGDQPATDEQIWARHILLSDEATAKTVSDLLAKGGDFSELAKQYSVDTGSGANGGDLGWFGKGAMVAEFENAAFSQEIGEIGAPVQSQFGYHIIQVLGRDELPLTASQLEQKREAAFTEWLATIRDGATTTTSETWQELIPPAPPELAIQ